MGFSQQEEFAIWLVSICCATLSVIGSGFTCLLFLSFPTLRDYSFRLIFYLAIADLLLSINFMIPEKLSGSLCWLQGAALNYVGLCQVFIAAVICYTLYKSYSVSIDSLESKEKFVLCFILILSAVLTSIPFITFSYGEAQGICWINASGSNVLLGSIYRLVAYYLPCWIIMFYCCVVYSIIVLRLNSILRSQECCINRVVRIERRLLLYPIILMLCIIPSSVNRILLYLYPDDPNLYLMCISVAFNAAIGFFHACAYGITPNVKYAILSVLRPHKIYDSMASLGSNASMSN